MRDELEVEPAESGSVSHGNLLDSSAEDTVQNGKQSLAVPAEAGSGVFGDVVPAVEQSEVPDLSIEVFALVLGADAGVTDARRLFLESGDAVVVGAVKRLPDAGDRVDTVVTWRAEDVDFPPFVPATQGRDADIALLLLHLDGGDERVAYSFSPADAHTK